MEKIIYLVLHFGLPLILGADFLLRRHTTKMGLLTRSSLYIAINYFLFVWGQWAVAGSYYMRYVVLIISIAIIGSTVIRYRSKRILKPLGIFGKISNGLMGLVAVVIFAFTVKATLGSSYTHEAVSLAFPLKGGTYYVASGGASKLLNNHMRENPTPQEYALDINKLGALQGVSKKIMSTTNTDHYIFSDTVYCPCNGTVLEIKNEVKDNAGSTMNVSAEDGTGNFVHIKCDEVYVFIPHFKQYSIVVSEGMAVKEGSALGLVGISGFAQEPHLHIQASKYAPDSVMTGVPIQFKGKILSRNDLYSN